MGENKQLQPLKTAFSCLLIFLLAFQVSLPPLFADLTSDPTHPLVPTKNPGTPDNGAASGSFEEPSASFLGGSALSTASEPTLGGKTILPLSPAQQPPVTKLPLTSEGIRPEWQSTVSYDPNNSDYSNLQMLQLSPSFLQVNFNLYNTTSQGKVYLDYDNPETAGKETANFLTAFPDGIVLGLDNGGKTATTQVYLLLIDDQGVEESVLLDGITANYQRWRINAGDFLNVNFSKIREVAFVFCGRQVDGRLNMDWGDAAYTPQIYSRPDNPQNYTPLPALTGGGLPVFKEYVSFDPANKDWSDAHLDAYSKDFMQLNFHLYNTDSIAGAYALYDDPATQAVESFNFNPAFPSGIVFGLDNGGFGNIQEAFFSLLDASGHEDIVKLSGITSERQYFKLTSDLFEEIDLAHIVGLAFNVEGRYSGGGRLNIQLGNFTTPSNLYGTVWDETKVTQLPVTAKLTEFGGDFNSQNPTGQIALTHLGSGEFEYQYTLWNGAGAYTTVDLTAPNNADFALPGTLVLAARGTDGGLTKVQITDNAGHTATFTLNLKAFYQNFSLALEGLHMPPFFDRNHITRIRFLQDRNVSTPVAYSDLIKVRLKGVEYSTDYISPDLAAMKAEIISKGLDYFAVGQGIDPVTHFPYDRSKTDGTVDPTHKITQPTLTGFYLQMLGDFVRGKLAWNGQTVSNALTEIDTVLGSLLDLQTQYGWNGLVPWIDQGQPYDNVGIGDNANLTQSLAVMIGALEMADLTPAQRTLAQAIANKAETFMTNQQAGYTAAVDKTFGLFPSKILRSNGNGVGFIDRLMTEFRGAIAFLLVRYPTLPHSVWDNLTYTLDGDYKTQNGTSVLNMQSYEGGAFQYFWPLLRNNERDYVGFRNALFNYFVTQTDFAAANHIPGFLSASDMPDNFYQGLQGIPQIAETQDPLLLDLGSTYALASGFAVNQYTTLEWLSAIQKQIPKLFGKFGFVDSGRSGTDANKFYLGIDIASTILGLTNAGPEAFETYLRNRGQEATYNTLYDQRGRFGLAYTYEPAARPPEFPDASYNVFNNVQVDGTLGSMTYIPTTVAGSRFYYTSFGTAFDGRFWEFKNTYAAAANQLEIMYSVKNSPKKLKIEIKDDSVPDKLLYETTVTVADDNVSYQKILINLPNDTIMNSVKKLFILPDQSTGDTSGDFTIHAINFKHYPSAQNLTPVAGGKPSGETTLDQPFVTEVISSNLNNHSEVIAPKTYRLYYDVSQGAGNFSALSFKSDDDNDGVGLFDFSQKNRIVFGLNSDKLNTVKIELDDSDGTRAVVYATKIDVARNYYELLTASLPPSFNKQKVKRISFVIDTNLAGAGNLLGSFDIELL